VRLVLFTQNLHLNCGNIFTWPLFSSYLHANSNWNSSALINPGCLRWKYSQVLPARVRPSQECPSVRIQQTDWANSFHLARHWSTSRSDLMDICIYRIWQIAIHLRRVRRDVIQCQRQHLDPLPEKSVYFYPSLIAVWPMWWV